MGGAKILEVKGLNKTLGRRHIVKDASFDVYEGEIFGFLGPNGAGKTTTIKMLSCLTRPSEGDALLLGKSVSREPEEVKKLFQDYAPDRSYASWAIRFVASLDGILTVLSGMSNVAQMEDNLSFMKDFEPLNEEEQAIIQEAQRILGNSAAIPCTSCRYCTEGCPQQIAIPDIFTAMNKNLANGQLDEAKKYYGMVASEGHLASDCIRCGQCEESCPQSLSIIKLLEQGAEMLET